MFVRWESSNYKKTKFHIPRIHWTNGKIDLFCSAEIKSDVPVQFDIASTKDDTCRACTKYYGLYLTRRGSTL